MDALRIPATDDTPEVILDASGEFEFSGKSLPSAMNNISNGLRSNVSASSANYPS